MAAAAVGEIWHNARTSYGADILPTERPCISIDKIIIITIIIVVGLGVSYTTEVEGMATGSVCVVTSKCRVGRSGGDGGAGGGGCFFFFFA